jgi:hypothetical protein
MGIMNMKMDLNKGVPLPRHFYQHEAQDMYVLLWWITRCAHMNMPHGLKGYFIADEIMEKARAVVAKVKP